MLTTGQKATLKAFIEADATLSQLAANREVYQEILDALHSLAEPDYIVWRSSLSPDLARQAIVSGDQLAQLDNLAASKRDSLIYAFSGPINCASSAVRGAIDNLCGTQNVLKAALTAAMKRKATVLEKLFAVGSGTDASPSTLVVETALSLPELESIVEG